MVRILAIFLIGICCLAFVLQGAGYAFWWTKTVESSLSGYTDELEALYNQGVEFADTHIVADIEFQKKRKWNRWFAEWNDELRDLKTRMRALCHEYPLVFDYFSIVLRNVHLVYEEYELLYIGEKSSFDALQVDKRYVEESFIDLRREIAFVVEKTRHGASTDFYQ